MTTSRQRQKLINASSLHSTHWAIICLSFLLTLAAWYFSKQQLEQKIEVQFNRSADQVIQLVIERMELYENALRGGVAFIDANKGTIGYQQWQAYASSLHIDETYPGINGIGVILNIKPDAFEEFILEQRKLRPEFSVHPEHSRDEYWPITYIEPFATNRQAVGLDIAFETNRYNSIIKARDSGKAQLTAPINLVQDSKNTPGFLFYAPFYRQNAKLENIFDKEKNIVGMTYAPFIMKNLMQGTLAKKNRLVGIKISDKGQLLFDDALENNYDIDPHPLFKRQNEEHMYGRSWKFEIQSTAEFRRTTDNRQPTFILLGGILLDFLIISLFIFLTRANRSALDYAEELTRELRTKSEKLQVTNQDLEQFIYVASHDLKSPLNAIRQLASWVLEDSADSLSNESSEHIRLLQSRAERMTKLLSDLLEYSHIDKLNYPVESVNLSKMSKDIFDNLIDNANKFSCKVPDITICLPKIPLEIVLRNLMSNSIKHHHLAEGLIQIFYHDSENAHILEVLDDGPGIPPDMHEKALEVFQTLKPRDHVEGSGMGLAISRRIIEHHGGKLEIAKNNEFGTLIRIHWPKIVVFTENRKAVYE